MTESRGSQHRPEHARTDECASRRLAVVGQGYVGLPLAIAAGEVGMPVVGVDIDQATVDRLNAGIDPATGAADPALRGLAVAGLYQATTDFAAVSDAHTVVVCVPTPLQEEIPDLSAVKDAAQEIGKRVRAGALVVLESTSYPGTTEEVFAPLIAEVSGLDPKRDLDIAFSPERIDPGNERWGITNTPKVVGGLTERAAERAAAFYGRFVQTVVPVSSPTAAEMAKLLENTYRHINIALANEMAMLCHALDIDVWEVIEAAATKPFGFQAFYPGPGVGGHCIPIDPMYLSWRAQQLGSGSRFITLAREVNAAMPAYVVQRVQALLNDDSKPVRGSEILLLGVTYKPDVADLRESPALAVAESLVRLGARVRYADPFARDLDLQRVDEEELDAAAKSADCVVVLTGHSSVDHDRVAAQAQLLLDTRGVVRLRAPHVHFL